MKMKTAQGVLLAVLIIHATSLLAADASDSRMPSIRSIANAFKKTAFTSEPSATPQAVTARLPESPVALIFTAPPRETPDEGKKIYQPIAEFLSKALGKKVVYQHPETWGLYRTKMLNGSYDLIFDDPHFASYRVENLNYTILVKLPEQNELAVFVSNQTAARDVRHMAGRTFCTHAPPDLGALVLLSQFDNPARQPVIVDTKGWEQIYNGVIAGKCDGGVMPLPNLKKFDRANLTRIIYITMAMPNQAVSAGPHVLPDDQTKIVRALLAPEADASTVGLRAAYKAGNRFVPASNQEYHGLAKFLRNEWGYY
jgi:ABC-type phosphate/phosphonate transport system substrate-binding protein